jgi:hypothetical protein
MNWATLYITGRDDFRDDVRKKLEGNRLNFMPGYIDSDGTGKYDLYWLDEKTPLKDFKEAIGSKLVWKYRLRFYTNLEDFLQSVNKTEFDNDLSDDERGTIITMKRSA